MPSIYEPPDPVLTATEHPQSLPESLERLTVGGGTAASIVTEKSFMEEALLAPDSRNGDVD